MAPAPLILVIEPDAVLRDSLESQLHDAGFRTRHAPDSDEALAILGDESDLAGIAVAWELPEGICMKLVKRILSREEFEGGLVIYDCPKPRVAEDKLEEWAEDGVEYAVLEAPSDAESVVEALSELVD